MEVTPERPTNLVMIIIDTLRADRLTSYGCEQDTSPAWTRLAEGGVQFDRVTAQSSWTLPSVGSLLTSRYPRSLGLYLEDGQRVPDEAETLAEILQEAGYATFGVTANPNLNSRYNFDQGFEEYADSSVVFHMPGDGVPEGTTSYLKAPLRSSPEVLDECLRFAQHMNGTRPAFIQVNLMEVHEHKKPIYLRPDYTDLFEGSEHPGYLRAVRQVTDDVEEFVQAVSALPGWDNTLFVVLSDHGEGLADHPGVVRSAGHGSLLYESSTHVPWLLFHPAWSSGAPGAPSTRRIGNPLRLLDVLPTVLEGLGQAPAAAAIGRSAWPLLFGRNPSSAAPEFIVTETFFRGANKLAAQGQEWQYISNRVKHPGLPRHELQALGSPPNGQRTDASGKQRKRVRDMRSYLDDWERQFPRSAPVLLDGELSEAAAAQLEAIGYLGGDEQDDLAPENQGLEDE